MDSSAFWLTTPRVGLRRFRPDDLDWMIRFRTNPDVRWFERLTADAIAENFKTRTLRYYDEHPGLGNWLSVDRATGQPIGTHNLNHVRGESSIQVGFSLAKS